MFILNIEELRKRNLAIYDIVFDTYERLKDVVRDFYPYYGKLRNNKKTDEDIHLDSRIPEYYFIELIIFL